MPAAPLRPCAHPGCPKTQTANRCEDHKKQYGHQRDDPATATRERKFYWSTAWRSTRAKYLRANPLCVEHQRENKIVAAEEVDHIVPIANGGDPLDWGNLQGLCKSCHSAKTRKENPTAGRYT